MILSLIAKKFFNESYGKSCFHSSHLKTLTMEANSILYTDMLDILFEGRNKEYGAYELRKTYNKRIRNAIAATTQRVCYCLY